MSRGADMLAGGFPKFGARLCRRPAAAMPEWELRFKISDPAWFATLLRLAFSTVALRYSFDAPVHLEMARCSQGRATKSSERGLCRRPAAA